MGQDLRARLAKLCTGQGKDGPCARDASVQTRLARLGRRSGTSSRGSDTRRLAELLGGRLLSEGVIELEREVVLDDAAQGWDALRRLPEAKGLKADEWQFLDTETTGLAGGTGTLVFLIGLARRRPGTLQVRQWLLTQLSDETQLLMVAQEGLRDAGLVSFNGKGFDVPLLSTRARLARLPDTWSGRAHLDLLYPVRRAFAGRWPDCRLATLERRLLGFARAGDLPGSAAPQAWLDFIRRGDPGNLLRVVEHNRQDLLSLARAVSPLAEVHREPWRFGAAIERVAQAWLRVGESACAMEILESAWSSLGTDGLALLGRLLRRAHRWESACAVWRGLAAGGNVAAMEQLAIYYEHVERDLEQASSWAARLPPGPARDKRLSRLEHKQGRVGAVRWGGPGEMAGASAVGAGPQLPLPGASSK